MGYIFNKWIIKENGKDATDTNIIACVGELDTIHIIPSYTEDVSQYTLNVYSMTEGQGTAEAKLENSYTARVGNTTNVSSTSITHDGYFKYWSLDGTNAVSYDSTYSAKYGTVGTYDLYAVFGAEEASPEATISITQMYAAQAGSKYKITTTYKSFVPDDCTVLEAGFVYGTSKTTFEGHEDLLVLDGAKTYKHLSGLTAKSQTYTFNGTVTKPNTTLYIRGFLIYKDKDGNRVTIYSSVSKGSYDSLNN
jgi:hypothetical protein